MTYLNSRKKNKELPSLRSVALKSVAVPISEKLLEGKAHKGRGGARGISRAREGYSYI